MPRRATTALFAALLPASLSACTDPEDARRVAELHGLAEVVAEDHAYLGCGRSDRTRTRIHARDANGHCLAAVVCIGWFNGETLRVIGPSEACEPVSKPKFSHRIEGAR